MEKFKVTREARFDEQSGIYLETPGGAKGTKPLPPMTDAGYKAIVENRRTIPQSAYFDRDFPVKSVRRWNDTASN